MHLRRAVQAHRALAVLGCAALVGVLLAACSNTQASVNRRPHTGSTTASVVDGVQDLTVTAGATYRFDPSTITVHPGTVRIDLVNSGAAPHNWTLLGVSSAATPTTGGGQHSVVQFTTPAPGRYTFVCTIHQKQGQTGTLVVLPN